MKTQAMIRVTMSAWMLFATASGGAAAQQQIPGLALIPAGSFEMGDHHGFVDPKHGGDETPIHTVRLGAFHMGIDLVTTKEYCEFLNGGLARQAIEVRQGGVYLRGGNELLCETREMSPYSRIGWSAGKFTVLDGKENHPIVCVRWPGAACYCNWLSGQKKLPVCYNLSNWDCDFNKSGFRLPTEAEWEYAGRGGLNDPYRNFPWGDDADATKANWPESKNPFRAGPEPWTTPVGFFNGKLQRKADFNWPGDQESFQTSDGTNGYGLHDMSGNVWQFINDWYGRDYYAYSPTENPPGPASGSLVQDGKPYRGMRGGNWYNGENGHGRVSNRNPSYYRGPQDPDHPYYHLGFRVVLPVKAESRPIIHPTPVAERGERPDARSSKDGERRQGREKRDDRERPGEKKGRGMDDQGNDRKGESKDGRGGGSGSFVLSSPEISSDGLLPAEFTADGSSATLPLSWAGAPSGTENYAVIMHHQAPDMTKWYWILYNIPADVQSLPKNVKGIGTLGTNSVNDRTEYAPPKSKGPGAKTYIYTIYALSAAPELSVPPSQVNREVLLAAMKDRTLASADLSVSYTRQGESSSQTEPPVARPPRESEQGGSRSPGAINRQTNDRQGGGGNEGGRHDMPENKTPVSPNAGQTVGLFLNTPKACPGYTLFAPKHNMVTYLMNNAGQVVHSWKSEYEPGQVVHLLPNGHLIRACMLKVQGGTGGGEGGRIEEYDWEGNLIWEFDHATRDYQLHHDLKPLPNGNVLALMVERKSREQALAAGFEEGMMRDEDLVPDALVEIQPIRPKGGKIVWEWHVWDHLIQDSDRSKPNYGDPAEHPERIYVKCNGRPTAAFWNHMNSFDYNAKLDQIVLSVRGCNEIWVLDHSTTTEQAAGRTGGTQGKGGDLIYRWGNPAAYGRGTAADKQLIQQHDAQWIPDGYPGAGHMTIFNNGYDRGWSSVEEIVLPVDAKGKYLLRAGMAYGPEKPVWHYEAKNRTSFFSSEISGAHRLPNGNTLICAGVVGHLFEVTPTGEMAWQYVNPMVRGGILAQGELPGKDMRGHLWNAVFKVHRYALDYPGLKGRDLTPKGVIELPASEKGKTGLDGMTEEQRTDRGPGPGGPGRQEGRGGRDDRSSPLPREERRR